MTIVDSLEEHIALIIYGDMKVLLIIEWIMTGLSKPPGLIIGDGDLAVVKV